MQTANIQNSKYFIYIGIFFVVVLMISNTVGAKIVELGPFTIAGATLLFPLSYIFGDILTEVYGYRASRKIIWSGFIAIIFMAFAYWFVQVLPAAPFWQGQSAYDAILGGIPRIVLASICAYFAGEFSNSYILSRMKVRMNGKHLWMRTIGSTVVGEAVDTIAFITIAFAGIFPMNSLLVLIGSGYILKVLYEIAVTPLTYLVVNKLKKAEGIDVYDHGINYSPFVLKEN